MKRGIALLLLCLLSACTEYKDVTIKKPVDLQRYAGKWYEIASFPTHFNADCSCTTITYTVHRNHIDVNNTCYTFVKHKKHSRTIEGKAFPIRGSANSHWSIEFYWPLKANYWIVYVSDDYQYALVAEPSKNYLWILARTPTIDPRVYESLLERLRRLGFDLELLRHSHRCGS